MEIVIPVLVLALAVLWLLLKRHTSKPTTPPPMTDARELLADRVATLAAEARRGQRDYEAQTYELEATWLRTRPQVGGDAPPVELDAGNERHVRFAGVIWERYKTVLAEKSGPFARCQFKPQSLLPYPKRDIAKALAMLLDVGEGRVPCRFIQVRSIPPEAIDTMKGALERLDRFVDVPPGELPADPEANATFGSATQTP